MTSEPLHLGRASTCWTTNIVSPPRAAWSLWSNRWHGVSNDDYYDDELDDDKLHAIQIDAVQVESLRI